MGSLVSVGVCLGGLSISSDDGENGQTVGKHGMGDGLLFPLFLADPHVLAGLFALGECVSVHLRGWLARGSVVFMSDGE